MAALRPLTKWTISVVASSKRSRALSWQPRLHVPPGPACCSPPLASLSPPDPTCSPYSGGEAERRIHTRRHTRRRTRNNRTGETSKNTGSRIKRDIIAGRGNAWGSIYLVGERTTPLMSYKEHGDGAGLVCRGLRYSVKHIFLQHNQTHVMTSTQASAHTQHPLSLPITCVSGSDQRRNDAQKQPGQQTPSETC